MEGERAGDTCWSLIQRAAGGETQARSTFSRSYLPLVRAFLVQRWRGSSLASEVDDAVQEVFVDCFRPRGPLERADAAGGDFRGFLFGVVRNVALRFEERGRAARARGALELPDDLADGAVGVSRVFDREWALALMREAAAEMGQRAEDDAARLRVELLRLRFGSDVPVRDIAERWSMDPDAVHRAYARARDEFRACLRRVVAFHSVRSEAELDDECRRLLALLSPDA
ncbi:MAG: sigma-70 family RNA polymerase sigma factor [Planctomycetes bacterium]|nr:sigma-70 family RNA polymerase sigma factor [Planctomycetota bacterium]